MTNFHRGFACVMLAALALATPSANAAEITGEILADSQITPNSSKGAEPAIPLYAMVKAPGAPFKFNQHYSQMPVKWAVELPAEYEDTNYQITEAQVVVYLSKKQPTLWDPSTGQLKLFGTGFSGDSSYTLENWTEGSTYYGPGAATELPLQDPYLIELGTGNRAEDNLEATPWAAGDIGPGYDGTALPAEAIPVTFTLPVNNAQVRDYLKDGLDRGYIMFTIAATYPTLQPQPGQPAIGYPYIVAREGVGNTEHGTIQQAPALTIEVAPQASASNWHLY